LGPFQEETGFYSFFNIVEVFVQYARTLKSYMSHFSCITLCHRNSQTNWAKELFKPSKDARIILISIFF